MLASSCFTSVYQAMGASSFLQNLLLGLGGKWAIFIVMQLTFFVLGMLLDPTGIIMLTASSFPMRLNSFKMIQLLYISVKSG